MTDYGAQSSERSLEEIQDFMWETREIVVLLAKMRKSGREWHLMANFRQVEKYFLSLSANTEACCFLSQLFAFVSCIFLKDYLIITEKM